MTEQSLYDIEYMMQSLLQLIATATVMNFHVKLAH